MKNSRNKQNKQKGFSLIELLIVVAIILIIAAIAIPSMINSRRSANESSAVGSLREVRTAEVNYQLSYPKQGFATLTNLGGDGSGPLAAGELKDSDLTSGVKSGYKFTLTLGTATPPDSFVITAEPQTPRSGKNFYCMDHNNVIRKSPTAITFDADTGCDATVPQL